MPKAWDKMFKNQGTYFKDIHQDMPQVIEKLKKMNAAKVLDLGCGSGRHTVYLATNGFETYGLDNSPKGIEITSKWLKDENLQADLQICEMTKRLPYDNHFFDAVISVQVIHHATVPEIKQIVSEIERVLKSGGLIFINVPTLKTQATKFKEIEKNTYVHLDGIEKGMPHHYFTEQEFKELFSNFDILDIHLDQGNHFCLTGYKH